MKAYKWMVNTVKQPVRGGLLLWMGLAASQVAADGTNTISIAFPWDMPLIVNHADPYFSSNNASVYQQGGGNSGIGVKGGVIQYPVATNATGQNIKFQLMSSDFGHNIEHNRPDSYLGEPLKPPDVEEGYSIDWEYMATTNGIPDSGLAFYTPSVPAVYASAGGVMYLNWRLVNGEDNSARTSQVTYVVANTSTGRPYRIYWTDAPYNAPPVSLAGKFFKIHYTVDCPPAQYQVTTNANGAVISNVVYGLYVDSSSSLRVAVDDAHQVEGMFLLEYFKTGSYEEQLGVIVVKVMRPDIATVPAVLGSPLWPISAGYNPAGLQPKITKSTGADGSSYIFQQTGGPKDGWIFPIASSIAQPWNIEVYWEAPDPLGTMWPFEVDWYAADWPEDPQIYVRGDGTDLGANVYIPTSMVATVQTYQEPPNHASVVSNNVFMTSTNNGLCLLKLDTSDNTWFVPVRSVSRTYSRFCLNDKEWTIGDELRPYESAWSMTFPNDQACLKTAPIALSSSFSMGCWIYTPNLSVVTNGELVIFDQNIKDGSAYYDYNTIFRLRITSAGDASNPSRLNGFLCNGASSNFKIADTYSAAPLKSFTWYHVVYAYDDDQKEATLFLNGELDATTYVNGTRLTGAKPLYIGRRSDGGTASYPTRYHGMIDDIRVVSRAVSQSEVYNLYNGSIRDRSVEQMRDFGIVAYWPIRPEDIVQLTATNYSLTDGVGGYTATTMNGAEMVPDGGVGLSVLDGYSAHHGYVYEPFGTDYNVDLYQGASQVSPLQNSYIYGVNTNNLLEIWWARNVIQDGMPDPLYIPAEVQHYENVWPETPPEIVLASFAGSSAGNVSPIGHAIEITPDLNGYVEVQPGVYFAGDFSIEGWAFLHAFTPHARLLEFGNGPDTNNVILSLSGASGTKPALEVSDGEGRVTTLVATEAIPTGVWTHVAATLSGGVGTLYINGKAVGSQFNMLEPNNVMRRKNYIGHSIWNDVNHPTMNGVIDEVRVWNRALSAQEVLQGMYVNYGLTEADGLVMNLPFDEGSGVLTRDLASGKWAWGRQARWFTPGAAKVTRHVYTAAEAPSIYYQNDAGAAGFNPNEEHAFIAQYAGGYTVFALRDDLNQAGDSKPFVLVNYRNPETDDWKMDVYKVVRTNELFKEFALSMTSGTVQPGPIPLTLLPSPWTTATTCEQGPGWRDRKSVWWAKAASNTNDWKYATNEVPGVMIMRNYYPMQSSFWFPGVASNQQPAPQTPIPWLYDNAPNNFWTIVNYPTKYKPIPVSWTVTWPSNAPQMSVGQTQTTPAGGLPDIWDQNSVDILYDQATAHDLSKQSVALYDPVQAQSVTLDYPLAEYGLDAGGHDPQIYNRNGKYYFNGLAPDISGRLYYDPARSEGQLRLAGQLVEGLTQSYLLVNVLTDAQRTAIKNIVAPETTDELTAQQKEWNEKVDNLATSRVEAKPNVPFEHLALSALGTGKGYVTLVMNNATNPQLGVASSDPISLVVIEVATNLLPGVVIPIEDFYNTLSDQMTMLHSLDFAGQQENWEYDWRWQNPNDNGTTPSNPENSQIYAAGTGVYAVVIGGESATLDDMVNRFFAVRYRAVSPKAVAVCGTNWSAFTSFALSEGWVQRVLNALTPFEQRMRDLYNNEVELGSSMIEQAGPPYEGDVALNMDSVESVGLIQIYQTVLNRAIALSLNQGIDSIAANQQLMLAATRLNDLYMVLGNEAYSDAQDPTIGFGSTQSPSDGGSIDYGQMATSLFCFDNQVPTLLDEELALLRGVGTTNLAPGVGVSPVYNRLWWNYTKGITEGEVAYSANYNIAGIENVILDAATAKEMFPQGHGDAWGHYLSALWGYYRLMQYTNFNWGAPSITPMLMNDLTIDADYFDEARFAQSAAALARAGKDVVNRTYRKAYTEHAEGTLFPGYRDSDPNRAWGVGEWGGRAGMGAFYNWVAANSLLPLPTEWQNRSASAMFGAGGYVALPSSISFSGDFTIEGWVNVSNFTPLAQALCFGCADGGNQVFLSITDGAEIRPYLEVRGDQGAATAIHADRTLTPNEWFHIAVVLSGNTATLYINGEPHGVQANMNVPLPVLRTENRIGRSSFDEESHYSLAGSLAELRLWDVARTPSEIQADMSRRLSGTEQGLVAYWPLNTGSGTTAFDLTRRGLNGDFVGNVDWSDDGPIVAGNSDYTDEGILKIDRSTVRALNELAVTAQSIQREVDNADLGLNPMGLSRNAVLFDISPSALDAGQSHFEQILERAERALQNAKSSFDAASLAGKLIRQQVESSYNFEVAATSQERSYKRQLIEIFGYPYADDIGAGRTYPEGYDGPDLYHYMYVDMSALGWSGMDLEPVDVFTYEFESSGRNSELLTMGFATNAAAGEQEEGVKNTLSFSWARNGLPVMPTEWSGERRAQGKLQTAWSDYLQAYLGYSKALEYYEQRCTLAENALHFYTETWYPRNQGFMAEATALSSYTLLMKSILQIAAYAEDIHKIPKKVKAAAIHQGIEMMPVVTIVGVSNGGDLFSTIRAALKAERDAAAIVESGREVIKRNWEKSLEYVAEMMKSAFEIDKATYEFTAGNHEQTLELVEKTRAVQESLFDLKRAFETLNAAYNNYQSVLAEGQRLLDEREFTRSVAANNVAQARYRDMSFRIWRSELLQQYASTFELAAMYTYLAAKAYDYETAMLSSEASHEPGSKFFASVVKARTLGLIDPSGVPLAGNGKGDPGLADILARMKANWSVLKGRLGFNNPDRETSRMSLRTELFRILPGTEGDENWRLALENCKVDDLFEVDVFRRYCLPFTSQDGLHQKEPGLVIPFNSTIDYARNFFGKPLAGGDHAYDSSHFATKIRSVGIWFSNYNANVTSSGLGLANTPRVYIVPAGSDAQRSPTASSGAVRYWKVLDQAIPVPYALDGEDLNATDYIPLYDSLSGGFSALRRYASLRAYHDGGSWSDSELNGSSRLVGRSVWNTQWYLIIPAGTLNNNRTLGLEAFINGAKLDGNGVKDIKILFETYSNAGN